MVASARRYEPFVLELVQELDDPTTSMAETCRRVADRVQELGYTRPSLVHLRTFVRAERDRKHAERRRNEALAEVIRDVAAESLAGHVPTPQWVIDRIEQATGKIWR